MKIKISKFTSLALVLILMATCFASCNSGYIDTVKYGSPNDYPDSEWGEQLDLLCSDGEWTEFESDDGQNIVEYNGTYASEGTLCLQFEILEDDNSFEICYMDIDGEECSTYEIVEFVTLLFEGSDY